MQSWCVVIGFLAEGVCYRPPECDNVLLYTQLLTIVMRTTTEHITVAYLVKEVGNSSGVAFVRIERCKLFYLPACEHPYTAYILHVLVRSK